MRLVSATPEDAVARDVVSHAEWGHGLAVLAHLAREARLRAGWWPRQTLTTWLWRDDERVLASCETYRMPSRVRGVPGETWGIASVFTEEALRGRGYAGAMLEALAARMRTEPGAQALVLFSDIGVRLYERLGYAVRPAFDRVLPAATGPVAAHLFGESELATIPLADDFGGVSIVPSHAQLDWHLDRSRTMPRGARRPDRCGARRGDDVVVWSDDGEHLIVVYLQAREHAAALLAAAADTAARWGLRDVVAWETPGVAWTGERVPRDGKLPMLKPLAAGVAAEDWAVIPKGVWV